MMKTEVSNIEYMEFLYYLKINEEVEKLEIAEVHMDGWDFGSKGYLEPMKENYYGHSAYHDYPVVNITREAAEFYCGFLKEALNEAGVIKDYKVVSCRLPLHEEWMMAAQGGNIESPYPWKGHYLRNSGRGLRR